MEIYETVFRLLDRMKRCEPFTVCWRGTVYRSTSPQYATSKDILSGKGSQRVGGRWNGIGTFPTLYTSSSMEAATAETLAHQRYYNLPEAWVLPRVFVSISISLQCVLDIRDGSIRQRLLTSNRRIKETDWHKEQDNGFEALTQALGRACFEVKIEGMFVPSVASNDGFNIIVFPMNLRNSSLIKVDNADQLLRRRRQGSLM